MNEEIYPYDGAKYIATYDDDRDDGTWIVWSHPYHYGIGLTEEEAKARAEQLNYEDEHHINE
jgi:hypothetical protein